MDDRILRELIYLARSNDPVALRSLYVYYDALVNTVMRKMKYISSMSLEAQDLEKVWELVYAIIQNETSERDQKIFHLVLLGYPEKEVALMLNISIKCVYNSVYRVMSKLRAHPLGEFLIIN